MLAGIEGLQGYCLLAEAGYIRRPAAIHGYTNPTMARLAERAGLSRRASLAASIIHKVKVQADYPALRDVVFSEEMQVKKALLRERVRRIRARV
jgi:hypothetical protein